MSGSQRFARFVPMATFPRAVGDDGAPIVVRNEDVIGLAAIDESEFEAICDSELAEIERRRQRYIGDRPCIDVAGRVAIVIDDGP
jgi:putative phosphoribosyl transferase